MTSLALNFLGGAPFQLLYDSVKTAIGRTRKFRTHLINLKSTLDCLQIIQQISDNNVQLSLPNDITQDVLVKMEDGAALIDELSRLSMCNIHVWGNCCNCIKPNYADQLDELDRSLRRLLELLKLEQMRNVTLLMLKLDEVQRGQSDILKALQENRGVRAEQQVIQRIQENGQHREGNRGGAAPALGAVFGMLVDVVIQMKVKNLIFKRLLGELKSSLDYLKPLIEEIAKRNKVFHLPKHEVENFISEMEKGIELVHKCSKVRKWASYKKYEYTSKLLRLDEYLQRLFIELKGQLEMNVKEVIDSQTSIEVVIKQIEEGDVVQNGEIESAGWSSVPKLLHSPPVGLDLRKTEGICYVIKETLVDSAGIIEEGVKPSEGSDVIQNQIQSSWIRCTECAGSKGCDQGDMGIEGRELVVDSTRNVQVTTDVKETLVDSAGIIEEGLKPSQGKELAKQLILNPSATSSSPDTREFSMQEKLSSYEEEILTGCNAPQTVGGIAHVPESLISDNASPCGDDDQQDLQDVSKKRKTLARWTKQVRVSSKIGIEGPLDDGYSWRKYGQKEILGAKYPRGYYRCTHRNTQGCLATKQVQRMDEDQTIVEITYRGNHTCRHVSKLVPPPSPQQQEEMNLQLVDNFWGTSSRALTSSPAGKSTQIERRSAFDLTGYGEESQVIKKRSLENFLMPLDLELNAQHCLLQKQMAFFAPRSQSISSSDKSSLSDLEELEIQSQFSAVTDPGILHGEQQVVQNDPVESKDQCPLNVSNTLDDEASGSTQNPVNQANDVDGQSGRSSTQFSTNSSEIGSIPKKQGVEARVAFRTKSELEVMDDGFRWRKYGKKSLKNSPNPRNYYKCAYESCPVKKRVERDREDPSYVITTYEAVHNHI